MDQNSSVQDPFPLLHLPGNILSRILGKLEPEFKNNLRLTSKGLNDLVTVIDLSQRKWFIPVTPHSHQLIQGQLSASIAKLESAHLNPKISVVLYLKSLSGLASPDRTAVIKEYLTRFGKYITGLSLKLHGDELFLLHDQYRLPNLNALFVASPLSYHVMFNFPRPEAIVILEDLLVSYGGTLNTLVLEGIWNINNSGSKQYNLIAMKTLSLYKSMPIILLKLVLICGKYITTLEMDEVIGDDTYSVQFHLPKLKHLFIDCDTLEPSIIELIRSNAKNLQSLIIFCDEREADFYPDRLPTFEHLELLGVNCPILKFAILERCKQTLEYLYVPEQKVTHLWNALGMNLPTKLPALKDLCVDGTKRWSLNMIKKNASTLEYLTLFGYIEHDRFMELSAHDVDSDEDSDDADAMEDELDLIDNNDENVVYPGGRGGYYWNELANSEYRLPKLKVLLLPNCTDTGIVESLTAKCPPDVKVLTDLSQVGKAFKRRNDNYYSYTRYSYAPRLAPRLVFTFPVFI